MDKLIPAEHLGETLRIPLRFEEERIQIEQALPPVSFNMKKDK